MPDETSPLHLDEIQLLHEARFAFIQEGNPAVACTALLAGYVPDLIAELRQARAQVWAVEALAAQMENVDPAPGAGGLLADTIRHAIATAEVVQ